MAVDEIRAEAQDALAVLTQVGARIAHLEARLEQVISERQDLANLATQQDRKLVELADAVADLTRMKLDARDAIDGILKLIVALESKLVAQRGG